MTKNKFSFYIIILLAVILTMPESSFCQKPGSSPLPQESRQIIIVLTDSVKAVKGELYFLEKNGLSDSWKPIYDKIPVVLGKNGLGWGQGFHAIDTSKLPVKKERDGRSPAGVFSIGAAFGYADSAKMKGLKIPYIPITQMLECIDDSNSKYYNKLILRNQADTIDWASSEKMNDVGVWYNLGVIVNHNTNPYLKGYGSCIFIHNWADPNETSSGCTEMNHANMKKLIFLLDSGKYPTLIQLTKQLYEFYKSDWRLPEINKNLP